MHPLFASSYAIGSKDGQVFILKQSHHLQLSQSELAYKCSTQIRHLFYSDDGDYLGICTAEQQPIIYVTSQKRIYKLEIAHVGYVNRIFIQSSLIFSIGAQGKLQIYQIQNSKKQQESEDMFETDNDVSFQHLEGYQICLESVTKKCRAINCSLINEGDSRYLLVAGQAHLQVITINARQTRYKIQTAVKQESQILQVQSLGSTNKVFGAATLTEKMLSIWNITDLIKVASINIQEMLGGIISSSCPAFCNGKSTLAIICNENQSDGKVFIFKGVEIVKPISKEKLQPMDLEPIQKRKEKPPAQPQQSICQKIIVDWDQTDFDKGYESYDNLRFLLYNNTGCIIERSCNEENPVLDLDLHDRSQISKLKIQDKNRIFRVFALREKTLFYASLNLAIYCEDSQLQPFPIQWQYQLQNITSVTIGAGWVALCNPNLIKILDCGGNQMHTICWDRRVLTMEAYEDMLIVVYHSTAPMFGSQSLKLRIYNIDKFIARKQRQINIPLTPGSCLKWLGFSEEGMVIAQDSAQIVRAYLWVEERWCIIFSENPDQQRLFISHVSKRDIYGFRIKQERNQRLEPRVIPRSVPRRIPFQIKTTRAGLDKVELDFVQRVSLNKLQIMHQTFRYVRWYKNKFSRKKNSRWYNQSKTIKSSQQIKELKLKYDLELLDSIKRHFSRLVDGTEKKRKVKFLSEHANFSETRLKIEELLGFQQLQKNQQEADLEKLALSNINKNFQLLTLVQQTVAEQS